MNTLCCPARFSLSPPGGPGKPCAKRPSFTLIELMLVVTIIAVLASSALFALYGTMEDAKEARTRSQIAKLNEFIMERWDSYKTRAVQLPRNPNDTPLITATKRLLAIREMQRFELPDRMMDVMRTGDILAGNRTTDSGIPVPGLAKTYWRMVKASWTDELEGAECLYMIISAISDGEENALDFFPRSEIGDLDGDGMNELLDGWGRPIEFLRWAPGLCAEPGPDNEWGEAGKDDDGNGVVDDVNEAGWTGTDDIPSPSTLQSRSAPDPFDPLRVDPRWTNVDPNTKKPIHTDDPFALFPLIYSYGRDGIKDISNVYTMSTTFPKNYSGPFDYSWTSLWQPNPSIWWPNDPYFDVPNLTDIGSMLNSGGARDNITNHWLTIP